MRSANVWQDERKKIFRGFWESPFFQVGGNKNSIFYRVVKKVCDNFGSFGMKYLNPPVIGDFSSSFIAHLATWGNLS
jgi:hypothetical protein